MKRKDPKYNPETKKAKYAFSIPQAEVKRDAEIHNDAPLAYNQNLAASYGMNFALDSLNSRYNSSK